MPNTVFAKRVYDLPDSLRVSAIEFADGKGRRPCPLSAGRAKVLRRVPFLIQHSRQ